MNAVVRPLEAAARAGAAPRRDHRFLVLTELFLPTKGGTAVWFDEVYRRLGGRGTHVLTAAVPGGRAHDAAHPNTVHRLRLERWRRAPLASLPSYARLLRAALRLSARHRFEAVHAGRVLPEGLVALAVARRRGLPLVVYAHGEEITAWSRRPRRRVAMRHVYRRADAVIANSAFTRGRLRALGVAPERIHVIHPGVDAARFTPGPREPALLEAAGIPPGARLILSVGRLSPRKGFDQVIRALPALVARGLDVHHAIVGIGEDEAHLRQVAREAGVAGRVHLLGHVPPEDLPRWYRACDVFAMPNRPVGADAEGFGMVYAEAAACARPAVAGRHGGTGDAVLDGITGLRVDGEDLDAVAAALAWLLEDRALAEAMGRAGRARVERELAWERVAERTAALHRALTEARP